MLLRLLSDTFTFACLDDVLKFPCLALFLLSPLIWQFHLKLSLGEFSIRQMLQSGHVGPYDPVLTILAYVLISVL